jgi:hypothetical protein
MSAAKTPTKLQAANRLANRAAFIDVLISSEAGTERDNGSNR